MKPVLIITCEHATNAIPKKYAEQFSAAKKMLESHRGLDIGALTLYKLLAKKRWAPWHLAGQWSRLLIDLNRSVTHRHLFSSISKEFSKEEQNRIIADFYQSYRTTLINKIQIEYTKKIPVLHLSLHSFTPTLNGLKRNCDIGLLYDPKRIEEKNFCKNFKTTMQLINPALTIRMNYPYLGTADGCTSYMRKKFPKSLYSGIEIEMNQSHFDAKGQCKTTLVNDIVRVLNVLSQK